MAKRTSRVGIALVAAVAAPSAARAERPHDGLFRASPGFGYALDNAERCTMQGRMFVGGFAGEYELGESGVFVGAGTTILFNTLLPDPPCGTMDGLRMSIGFVIGPTAEWYPYEHHGLNLFALAGYTNLEHDEPDVYGTGHGLGSTFGVGWDWRAAEREDRAALFGLRLQVTTAKTWTSSFEHRIVMPALVFLFGFD